MSSENLGHSDNLLFTWQGDEVIEDHVLATYIVSTPVDGEQAAFGIAREQSICATSLGGIQMPDDIQDYCAKVIEVEELPGPAPEVAPLYFLNTPVYGSGQAMGKLRCFKLVIAYPVHLFGNSLTLSLIHI